MTRRVALALLAAPLAARRLPAKVPAEAWEVVIEPSVELVTASEQQAIRFYLGEQWPPDLEHARLAAGRPCLVANRLPAIVRSIMQRHPERAECEVVLDVVRQRGDQQRFYNYCLSALAEFDSASLPRRLYPSLDADADAYRDDVYAMLDATGRTLEAP